MTDLDGLPHEFRHSLWILRQARSFGCTPSTFEAEPQSTIGHLEREQIVNEALKRHS